MCCACVRACACSYPAHCRWENFTNAVLSNIMLCYIIRQTTRLMLTCVIQGMLPCVCQYSQSHKVQPTWSSVAGNVWHTPAHSPWADSAHLHRTTSPSASDTENIAKYRHNVHTTLLYRDPLKIHRVHARMDVQRRCTRCRSTWLCLIVCICINKWQGTVWPL